MRPLNSMKLLFAVGLLVSVLGQTGPASASLIGDAVQFTGQGCSPCFLGVGLGGPELTGGIVDVNIQSSFIVFSLTPNIQVFPHTIPSTASSFDFLLADLDWVGNPSGVISGLVLTNNGVANLTNSDLSFMDHSVGVDVRDTTWDQGANFIVTLQTSHSAVPTPSAMLLMGTGLAALIGWNYRQEKKQ